MPFQKSLLNKSEPLQKVIIQLEAGQFHISAALGANVLPDISEKEFINAISHAANVIHLNEEPLETSLQKSNSPTYSKIVG